MSSNLLKRGMTLLNEEETRIIDSNARMAQKLTGSSTRRITPQPEDKDGFSRGLSAEVLDALTGEDGEPGGFSGELRAESLEGQSGYAEPGEEAADAGPALEELRQQAELEIENMKQEAAALLETERNSTLEAAKKQGYQEGYAAGMQEVDDMKSRLAAQKESLERQYQELMDELEPRFIDTLTGIYEHIFKVELSGYRDIVVELLANTMRKIDGGRNYIIHVSKDDYPYVSMQKKRIAEGVSMTNASLEIIEDITLSKNQALIETEGGIFDCSLGTQLSELNQKIRLLSYEKEETE